jgi:biopolymer transport protein ExbD
VRKVLNERKKVRIEMLPLIDIVFLLLVFFIYAMLSMAVHRSLPVALPTSDSAKVDQSQVLSVTVKSDGTLYLNRQPISLERLPEELHQKSDGIEEPGVLLFADRSLPYQKLYNVLDKIRMAGISRISLQADANEGP